MQMAHEIAIRLADEGVPLRAIARAVCIRSEDLREHLAEARDAGGITQMPQEDWPPGYPRDQRALQLSRLCDHDHSQLVLTVRRLFGLTPAGIRIFLALLRDAYMEKDRTTMSPVCLSVHIHNIRRRVQAHGINITTCWGHGYQMTAADRARAFDLILSHLAASA